MPNSASKHISSARKYVELSPRSSTGKWGYRHLQSEQKALWSHPEKSLITRQWLPAYTFIPSSGKYFQCKVTNVVGFIFIFFRGLLLHIIHHSFLRCLTFIASLALISSNYGVISLHCILVYSFLQNYFKNTQSTEKQQFILGDRGDPRLSAGPTA